MVDLDDQGRFNALLGEATHYKLLRNEMKERCYIWDKAKHNTGWRGGDPLPIRFEAAVASSIRYGKLTKSSEVNNFKYAKGVVDEAKKIWGSIKWKSSEIKIAEDAPINLKYVEAQLPAQLKNFMSTMKTAFCMNVLNSNSISKLVAAGGRDGVAYVKNIERIMLNQKLVIKAPESNSKMVGWVNEIDMNNGQIQIVRSMDDLDAMNPVVLDLSGLPIGSTIHWDGAEDKDMAFTSLAEQLDCDVPMIFGKSKRKYPYLQAVNFSGKKLGFNSDNFLSKLFDCLGVARQRGAGNLETLIMSMKSLNVIVKILERGSGPYRHIGTKASPYNYMEITIGGPDGAGVKCVGLYEKDDDTIIGPDWNSITIHSNQGFRREKSPDGNYYYVERTEDDYEYITDIALEGEIACSAPSRCMLIKESDFRDSIDDAMYLYGASPAGKAFTTMVSQPMANTETGGIVSEHLNAIKKFMDQGKNV